MSVGSHPAGGGDDDDDGDAEEDGQHYSRHQQRRLLQTVQKRHVQSTETRARAAAGRPPGFARFIIHHEPAARALRNLSGGIGSPRGLG